MDILMDIQEAVIDGNAGLVNSLSKQAIDQGIAVSIIMDEGLIIGMKKIGDKFKNNEVFVPEVLVAARAMHAGMDIIKPHLVKSGAKEKGTIILGTVKGDLHDIGKNMVKMMLEGAGFKIIDLGIDVPANKFVDAIVEHKPQVLCLSALLTTTMSEMQRTVEEIKMRFNGLKIVVGGAPVNQMFADEIGADGYADDAAGAVDVVNEVLIK